MHATSTAPLKRTPLHATHVAAGARLVPFAGWEMPVEYSGITDEHLAVRTAAGLFDVSHMGEIEIAGRDAFAAVQHLSINDAAKLKVGQIQYSALTTPEGTFVDDLLVYRLADEHYLLVINASNIDSDAEWIRRHTSGFGDAAVVNSSNRYALIAIQGPKAALVLQPLTGVELTTLKYYWFAHGEVAGVRATVSRTGYTGEDGFELFVAPAAAGQLWNALIDAGAAHGLKPAGLGARDTLRLEAAMRLYGNDIDATTSVLEADLGWIVGWNKSGGLGLDALRAQKAAGPTRKLVGFEMVERGIARHGYDIYAEGEKVGVVTSGTQTPFLQKAIGMGYVPTARATPGQELSIDVRGRRLRATVVPLPFYKRSRS
jgi:aminomethyltransferase